MATRKNEQIVSVCGGHFPADSLENLRADPQHNTAAIARAMSVSTAFLENAIAAADLPPPEANPAEQPFEPLGDFRPIQKGWISSIVDAVVSRAAFWRSGEI